MSHAYLSPGVPVTEGAVVGRITRRPTMFMKNWNERQVRDKIKSLFPTLKSDFNFLRDGAKNRLVSINNCRSAAMIAASLKRSSLYVVPFMVGCVIFLNQLQFKPNFDLSILF